MFTEQEDLGIGANWLGEQVTLPLVALPGTRLMIGRTNLVMRIINISVSDNLST